MGLAETGGDEGGVVACAKTNSDLLGGQYACRIAIIRLMCADMSSKWGTAGRRLATQKRPDLSEHWHY